METPIETGGCNYRGAWQYLSGCVETPIGAGGTGRVVSDTYQSGGLKHLSVKVCVETPIGAGGGVCVCECECVCVCVCH